MNHLKTHNAPTSAIELQRAYVYLPTTHWAAVEALRASTTLSVSQYLAHLITAAIAAKDTHDRSRTTH
jgi:hypothetical protein